MKKIKKIAQSIGVLGKILNSKSTSLENTYSCDYINKIIESESNENGNYIKFTDGTMICRGTATISITTNTWGSLHVCDWTGNISFPANFISKPTVNANSSNNSGAVSKVIATSNAITAISIFRGTSATNVDYAIDFIAIGKWK